MVTHPTTGQRQFKYFSRKAIDYTHLYGAHKHTGSLTPRIVGHINHEIEE